MSEKMHVRDKLRGALDHLESACNLLLSARNECEITNRSYAKLGKDIAEMERQIKYLLGEE